MTDFPTRPEAAAAEGKLIEPPTSVEDLRELEGSDPSGGLRVQDLMEDTYRELGKAIRKRRLGKLRFGHNPTDYGWDIQKLSEMLRLLGEMYSW